MKNIIFTKETIEKLNNDYLKGMQSENLEMFFNSYINTVKIIENSKYKSIINPSYKFFTECDNYVLDKNEIIRHLLSNALEYYLSVIAVGNICNLTKKEQLFLDLFVLDEYLINIEIVLNKAIEYILNNDLLNTIILSAHKNYIYPFNGMFKNNLPEFQKQKINTLRLYASHLRESAKIIGKSSKK